MPRLLDPLYAAQRLIWRRLFAARSHETPRPDRKEIAEAAFFALDRLPERLSPATARRIAEHQGRRERSAAWYSQ